VRLDDVERAMLAGEHGEPRRLALAQQLAVGNHGRSYVGRILVLDRAKGGVATAWLLHEMAARRLAPLALLLNRANPVMAQGAALAGITLMNRFEGDVTALVPNGATLAVDPEGGRVTIVEA
jgi:uncharacterized protein